MILLIAKFILMFSVSPFGANVSHSASIQWTVTTRSENTKIVNAGAFVVAKDFQITWPNENISIPAGELVDLSHGAMPAWPTEPHVLLANGDRIVGEVVSTDQRSVTIQNEKLGKLKIPLSTISVIWNKHLPSSTPLDPLTADWLSDRKTDIIQLLNGDIIRGTLDRISNDGASLFFKVNKETTQKVEMQNVVAISFATGLSRVPTAKSDTAIATFRDGSRITFKQWQQNETKISADAMAGFSVLFSYDELMNISVYGSKVKSLADIKPKKAEYTPFLQTTWPMVLNRSAKHKPMRFDTKQGISWYDRGIGLHAKTVLEYDLGEKYSRFDALLGLDAETGKFGMIPVQIFADDKEKKFNLLAESGPVRVSLDLSKAKSLKIIVDFGCNGDRNSDVNLANAKLLEAK